LLPFAIFCTFFIVYLSLSDISDLPKLEVAYEDKLYHFVAYFVLTSVWLLALTPYSSKSLRVNILISLGIIGFGIVIEIFQELITDYRVFDVFDILVNSIGVSVSYFCFELLKKRIFENINTN
jgi:VanZ family protein